MKTIIIQRPHEKPITITYTNKEIVNIIMKLLQKQSNVTKSSHFKT